VCVLRGPRHVFELVNAGYLRHTGRASADELVGLPIRVALPELSGQGVFEILDEVYQSGQARFGHERAFRHRVLPGPWREDFIDFVYEPIVSSEGAVQGV
jgi:hypothetical protein